MRTDQPAVREVLELMDRGWEEFRRRVHDLPIERLELRLGDGGWTRKQMLGHLTTWHDLTVDRLLRYAETGQPSGSDDGEDAINARAAHAAVGRTTGEILFSLEDSFRRLRREVSKLTDEQLAAHDSWAAAVIAGNSYGHYREHLPDLEPAAVQRR